MESLLASLIFVLRHSSKSVKILLLPVIWLEHPESKYHSIESVVSSASITMRLVSSYELKVSCATFASSPLSWLFFFFELLHSLA
ncbi:hypothetical protein QL285_047427 [Trifolium repens]|nr:hypothetical protein QL285_047427 [Trifolium repens]